MLPWTIRPIPFLSSQHELRKVKAGNSEGLCAQGGAEFALQMAKDMDATLHCQFTTFFFYVDQFEQSSGPGHHPMQSTLVKGITYKRGGKVGGQGS